jgi:hypothetical protein
MKKSVYEYLHGYTLKDEPFNVDTPKFTHCGLRLYPGKAVVLNDEGRPIKRHSVSVTLHPEWVNCPKCLDSYKKK